MLVLGRKEGERIKIGSNIYIEVLEIRSGQVKLGITAPIALRVMRQELLEEVFGEPDEGVVD